MLRFLRYFRKLVRDQKKLTTTKRLVTIKAIRYEIQPAIAEPTIGPTTTPKLENIWLYAKIRDTPSLGVIFAKRELTDGISAPVPNPSINLKSPNWRGIFTKAIGKYIAKLKASPIKISRCAPYLSPNLPSVLEDSIADKPTADTISPEINIKLFVFVVNVLI